MTISEAFEDQKKRNLITCPICGTSEVQKVLSPRGGCWRKWMKKNGHDKQFHFDDKTRQAIKGFYQYLETNFEDVGANLKKKH